MLSETFSNLSNRLTKLSQKINLYEQSQIQTIFVVLHAYLLFFSKPCCKLYGPISDCSFNSSLFRVHTVCFIKEHSILGS